MSARRAALVLPCFPNGRTGKGGSQSSWQAIYLLTNLAVGSSTGACFQSFDLTAGRSGVPPGVLRSTGLEFPDSILSAHN